MNRSFKSICASAVITSITAVSLIIPLKPVPASAAAGPDYISDIDSDLSAAYPSNEHKYAAQITDPVFDENGVIRSVSINISDASKMSSPSRAYIAVYDASGVLSGIAGSSEYIDDPTDGSIRKLTFDTELAVEWYNSYKIFLWSLTDDTAGSSSAEMIPYAKAYTPIDIKAYLLLGENSKNIEDFVYSGADYSGHSYLTSFNGWVSYGNTANDLTLRQDGAVKYAKISSTGTGFGGDDDGSFYLFKDLAMDIGSSGIYMISADLRYISGGGLDLGFTNGYSTSYPYINNGAGFTAFTINDGGSLDIGDTNIGTISAGSWTNVNYILNMDTGTASVSVAGGTPVTVTIPNYSSGSAPSPERFTAFMIEGQNAAFDVDITNLTVAKLAPQELPNRTVTVNAAGNGGGTGSVTIDDEATASKTVPQSTFVKLSAVPDEGSIFINWTDSENNVLSTDAEFSCRLFSDLNATANFAKQSGIDGITDYSISSDKGLVKFKEGEVCSLSLSDIKDASGYPAAALNTDAEWSCSETGVTVSDDGVVSLDSSFEIGEDTTKDVVISASLNDIERSYTLTVYSYDFYENVKDGKVTAAWDGAVTTTAERSSIAFPIGGTASTLTLPSPVSLDKAKTISFIAAGGGSGNSFCVQPRYIEFYDSNGNKVINDVIGYSWSNLSVGGTIGKESIDDPIYTFENAVTLGSWSDTVSITIDKSAGTATVQHGSGSAQAAINTDASNIAYVRLVSSAGAPDYTSRCLAITDITIR